MLQCPRERETLLLGNVIDTRVTICSIGKISKNFNKSKKRKKLFHIFFENFSFQIYGRNWDYYSILISDSEIQKFFEIVIIYT